MNNSTFISLCALLIFSTAFCQTNSKDVNPTVYKLTVNWPAQKYLGNGSYTKQDLPTFNGDNFQIVSFSAYYGDCDKKQCLQTPLNIGKIQESDYKYLSKYVARFGLDNHKTTKELYSIQNCCYTKTQTQYFSDMVSIHKKFNIIKTLKAKGIVPSKTKLYNAQDAMTALKDLFGGYEPRLHCKPNEFENQLTYISIFVDEKLNPTQLNSHIEKFDEMYPSYSFQIQPIQF